MIALNCPGCNASLSVDEKRDVLFCEYCGYKILLTNKREFTYHKIDDAEIRKAEAEERIMLEQEKGKRLYLGFLFVMFVFMIIGYIYIILM